MHAIELTRERGASVKTRVPGPRSAQLLAQQRELESNAVSYPRRLPIAIRRASGAFLEDVDGNVFIDFLTGAGALPLGHNHPAVVEAARAQLGELSHGLDFPTDVKMAFAAAQLAMLPQPLHGRMKIHFCGPTGADAVEAAIKLCKIHTGADEVVSFQGGYHGCTHGGLSLGGNRDMKRGVANRMPGVHFFPYSYCYRCPLGLAPERCEINCAAYLRNALLDANGGLGRPAAVLLELVQGEGGAVPARKEFVRELRAITAQLDIPLVVDEIQTGCGRTGTWYAFEQYDIEPDVIVTSKGLSGLGAPAAIMIYRKELDGWRPGAHIGTFRGNNVAFAAGLEMLRVMRQERTLENVRRRGEEIERFFADQGRRWAIVGDVRGLGLMWGIEIVDPKSGQPSPPLAAEVQSRALSGGLVVELGGRDDTVVRLLPPLNLTAALLSEALEILAMALEETQGICDARGAHPPLEYEI